MADLDFQALENFGFAVNLASIPDPQGEEAHALRARYNRDGLLVIRGLRLTQAEQSALCSVFGPVTGSPFDNFIVSNVEKDGFLGKRELLWHNDVPYLPAPYLGGSLHALRVAPEAVGTRYASGYLAYERLPPALRSRLENLKALQVRERVMDRPNRLTDLQAGDLCTVHDVVRANPVTGRKYLFVNHAWTAQIIGLGDAESDALLDEIFSHFYLEENVYEHGWVEGDLVVWDNLALQHARGATGTGVRTLQRVTIAEFGYGQQYPTDLAIQTTLGNEEMLGTAAA